MKLSEIIGKQVFVIYDAKFLGTVHDVAFDDKYKKVLGFYFFDQDENEYYLKTQNIFGLNDYITIKNSSKITNNFLLDKPLSPLGKQVVGINGQDYDFLSDIEIFKKNISPKISIYSGENDPTKILIKFNDTAPSAIADILNNRYKIEEEFSNHKSMLFICGVGTNVRKLNKLCIALNEISENTNKKCFTDAVIRYDLPDMKYTPRQAFFQDKVSIDTKNAINKISAEAITAYPPGIPVLLPGEVISKDILNKIEQSHIEICC